MNFSLRGFLKNYFGGYIEFSILGGLVLLATVIRLIIPWKNVFTDKGVVLGGNDPYYHLRLAEATVANFPHRMWFDPMTYFPHGSSLYWGPICDQLVAFLSLVIGLGSPTTETIYGVAAVIPAIFGILLVVFIYVLARALWGTKAAIFAALMMATLPGQVLNRTTLGFADHHSFEILFSTLTLTFIGLSLRYRQEMTFENIRKREFKRLRTPLFLLLGASLSFTIFILSWTGALMFAFLITIFLIVQAIVSHMKGEDTAFIAYISFIFIIPLLSLLPITDFSSSHYLYYSSMHVAAITLALFVGIGLSLLSTILRSKEASSDDSRIRVLRYLYPAALLGVGALVLVTLRAALPNLYNTMSISLTVLTKNTAGELTIAEATPIFSPHGVFTLDMINANFGIAFYLSLIGIAWLAWVLIKRQRPEELLMLVWAILIFDAMYQQNRFAYYYAMNVALLGGFALSRVLDVIGFEELSKQYTAFSGNALEAFKELLRNVKPWQVITVLFVVGVLLFYPPLPIAHEEGSPQIDKGLLPYSILSAESTGGPPSGWEDALQWMREATPDPGVDYLEIYDKPTVGAFPYPPEAYGVLSWWDYGHWILAIGHRMPNANPFQEGIGGGSMKLPGASTFFTATNESTADSIADELDTRYIVTDIEMATGKFYAMYAWAQNFDGWSETKKYGIMGVPLGFPVLSEKYHSSMIARLHLYDATNLIHYRLVHESSGYYVFYELADMRSGSISRAARLFQDYDEALKFYQSIKPFYVDNTHGIVAFDPLPPASYVKVFEYVPGAIVMGNAPDGTTVTISATIVTPERTFTYAQQMVATGGTYSFIVPYSTTGAIEGSTIYDVGPIEPYTIRYGNITEQVSVSEEDVLSGDIVYVG